MREVEEARKRSHERKLAAGISNNATQEQDVVRAAFSGLDIPFEEIMELANDIIVAPLEALTGGIDIKDVLLGLWVDGMAVGMMIQQRREES